MCLLRIMFLFKTGCNIDSDMLISLLYYVMFIIRLSLTCPQSNQRTGIHYNGSCANLENLFSIQNNS